MDFATLLPQFGGLLFTLAAFVVALSIIVFVHEFGHYIVGRWSGIHAEVFSLGFGPALWSIEDNHGTRWQIALLPFGGYVKFLGDSNAASAPDQAELAKAVLNKDEYRKTMHGAPLWARAATVVAGPVFNFILSIAVFAGIFMVQGRAIEPLQVGSILSTPNDNYELAVGDQLVAIQGKRLSSFEEVENGAPSLGEILNDIMPAPFIDYTVIRNGQEMTVSGPFPQPAAVGQVVPRSAAMDAGMEPDDVIIAVDGMPIYSFQQMKDAVEQSGGEPLPLTVWRNRQNVSLTLEPRWTDEPLPDGGFHTQWRIGIISALAFTPATETISPLAAAQGGVRQTIGIVQSSLSGLWHMVSGAISTCNMSGPIGIAETSGAVASQGVSDFIWFIAVLSTAVGMLNLFPIPALDGGHLVFYAYEAVAGKPPSEKWLAGLMNTGLALVLGLMAFALSNDIFC